MSRGGAVIAAMVAACVACACSSSEVRPVEIDGLGLEVAALVVVDADGRLVRVSAVTRAGDPAPPAAALEEGERAYVVGVTRELLLRALPVLARASLDGFTLELASPPASVRLTPEGGGRRARFALPADAPVWDVDLSPAPRALVDGLTASLLIPADDAGALALHPFGETAALVPLGMVLPGEPEVQANAALIRSAVSLSPDRLLILTERFLAVVERDSPLPRIDDRTRPAPYVHADALSRETNVSLLRDVVLDASGTRAWVVGEVREDVGRIWTLEVGEEGIRATGTATLTPDVRWPIYPEILAVAVDGRGTVIAGGSNAVVLVKGPGAAAFEARPRLLTLHREWVTRDTGFVSDITDIVASGDPQRPHLLGTESARLLTGNAERDEWDLAVDASVYQQSLIEPHITAVAVDPSSGDTWVTTRGGGLARQPSAGAPWHEVVVAVPPSLEPCATPRAEGGFSFPLVNGVWLDATHAYVALKDCTSLLRVRRDDESSSAIHRAGDSSGRRDEETDLQEIIGGARGPIVVGGLGSVYEVRE